MVIPAFGGLQKWSYAAIASFIAGVIPPRDGLINGVVG
jgi:hypothetical protein